MLNFFLWRVFLFIICVHSWFFIIFFLTAFLLYHHNFNLSINFNVFLKLNLNRNIKFLIFKIFLKWYYFCFCVFCLLVTSFFIQLHCSFCNFSIISKKYPFCYLYVYVSIKEFHVDFGIQIRINFQWNWQKRNE